jgi:hypothetical protein
MLRQELKAMDKEVNDFQCQLKIFIDEFEKERVSKN